MEEKQAKDNAKSDAIEETKKKCPILQGLKSNWILIIAFAFILSAFGLIFYTYWLIDWAKWKPANLFTHPSASGPLGDVVNGITAPILMLCMAVLTFLAFYVQFEFNKQQLRFNSTQIINSSFFELFKMHIDSSKTLSKVFKEEELHMNFIMPKMQKLENDKVYHGKDYFTVLRYYLWDQAYRVDYSIPKVTVVPQDGDIQRTQDTNPLNNLNEVVKLYFELIILRTTTL